MNDPEQFFYFPPIIRFRQSAKVPELRAENFSNLTGVIFSWVSLYTANRIEK